jgi:hypothetical protein
MHVLKDSPPKLIADSSIEIHLCRIVRGWPASHPPFSPEGGDHSSSRPNPETAMTRGRGHMFRGRLLMTRLCAYTNPVLPALR